MYYFQTEYCITTIIGAGKLHGGNISSIDGVKVPPQIRYVKRYELMTSHLILSLTFTPKSAMLKDRDFEENC